MSRREGYSTRTKARDTQELSVAADEFDFDDASSGDEGDDRVSLADGNDDRKQSRLQRNREIARKSRKRKRERVESLLKEVLTLREANRQMSLRLKMAQNKIGEATSGRGNRGKAEEEARLLQVAKLSEMLKDKCLPKEIEQHLLNYAETYSDFGEERRKLLKVHVGALEQLLLPTQISKMLLWLLGQNDNFYFDENPESLWNMICNELKLTKQQKNALYAQRDVILKENLSMKKCLQQLDQLESDVEKNMQGRRRQILQVMKTISPYQSVKFLQWVENNQVCVHMLNGEWIMNKQRKDLVEREIMLDESNLSSQTTPHE